MKKSSIKIRSKLANDVGYAYTEKAISEIIRLSALKSNIDIEKL